MCQQPTLFADRSDLGSTLRQSRQLQGRTLKDVATATRIPVKVLEALEENDLPASLGNTYARSFLVQYASHLGIPLKPFEKQLPAQDRFHIAHGDVLVPNHSRIIFEEKSDPGRITRREKDPETHPSAPAYRTNGFSAVMVAIATALILTSALRAYIGIEGNLGAADAAAQAGSTPETLAKFPGAKPEEYRPMVALQATAKSGDLRHPSASVPASDIQEPPVASITGTPPRAIIVEE